MARKYIYVKQLAPRQFDYIISHLPPRQALLTFPDYAVDRSFSDDEAAQHYILKMTGKRITIPKLVIKKHKKKTRKWHAAMRKRRRKLTYETKRKIAMKKIGVPLRKKTLTERLAISVGVRNYYAKHPKRRALDVHGVEHVVDAAWPLPEGWCYGRPRGKGGGRPRQSWGDGQ